MKTTTTEGPSFVDGRKALTYEITYLTSYFSVGKDRHDHRVRSTRLYLHACLDNNTYVVSTFCFKYFLSTVDGVSRFREQLLRESYLGHAPPFLRDCSVRRTGSKNRSGPLIGHSRRAISAADGVLPDSTLPVDVLGENDGQRVGVVARFQLWLAKLVDEDLHCKKSDGEWME